jgi:hypothetical protein
MPGNADYRCSNVPVPRVLSQSTACSVLDTRVQRPLVPISAVRGNAGKEARYVHTDKITRHLSFRSLANIAAF